MTSTVDNKEERDANIAAAFASGVPVRDLAKQYNLKRQTIYAVIKKVQEKNRKTRAATLTPSARNAEIVRLFLAGSSMPIIALQFDMTRQAVQLIIKKHGLSARDGGAAVRATNRRELAIASKHQRREEYCQTRWGCTLDQWQFLRSMHPDFHQTPIARFVQHRNNVLRKKIPWTLTLWSWWLVWNESGHYPERGRTKNSYCMVRRDGKGCYEVGNVIITTIPENLTRSKGSAKNTE